MTEDIPRIRLRNRQELELINQYRDALDQSNTSPEGIGKTKVWQTQSGEIRVSLTLKSEENEVVNYMDVREDMIEEMNKYSPTFKEIERKALQNPHLLVVDPADIHLGKYASYDETQGSYNREIALKRTVDGVRELLNMSIGFNLDKVVLVIGNDILHTDDAYTSKTTKGTSQNSDGIWHENFKMAKELYVRIIEDILPLADIHVVFCPSNHDFQSGFMLADTLHSWFRNHPNITFNVSMHHRKYYQYGQNMLEFDHGDSHKMDDTPLLMATDDAQMWANTKFRYSYKHHFHSKRDFRIFQKSYEEFHVTVEYLRSPSSADAWHDRKGYVNLPAIEAFVHSKNKGQVARYTSYVD